jgi:hypothetical protein
MSLTVPGWTYVRTVFEGQDIDLDGVNPWDHKWERLDGSIEVPHPTYPHQRHRLDIWEVAGEDRAVRFAAGELSNGVWCFYLPATT